MVDRLIRDFTREILGTAGRGDFMAYLVFECRRMNGVFLGEIPTATCLRSPWSTTRLGVRDAFMGS
ncbi:hypothetical protein [Paraburkholderia youngii]|uniref:hypothetical protein n=1 Tax=Paraburkholderia youngii TaxID=2782701 RepID=UPI003D1B0CA4